MRPSIIELREFYATPRGRVAARALTRTLSAMQREAAKTHAPAPTTIANAIECPLVAFGYAVPVLDGAPLTARHLMPQAQGAASWPSDAQSRTTLCTDERWPLDDSATGAVLLMHALEHSADPAALLAEAWRVLAPQGQLWLVVPNRRGLWALAEATPFGRGQPYTTTQLRRLLHNASFVPEGWRRALYTPPFKSSLGLATAPLWETVGPALAALHGGVIILRAVKQLYAPVGRVEEQKQLKGPGFAAFPA